MAWDSRLSSRDEYGDSFTMGPDVIHSDFRVRDPRFRTRKDPQPTPALIPGGTVLTVIPWCTDTRMNICRERACVCGSAWCCFCWRKGLQSEPLLPHASRAAASGELRGGGLADGRKFLLMRGAASPRANRRACKLASQSKTHFRGRSALATRLRRTDPLVYASACWA